MPVGTKKGPSLRLCWRPRQFGKKDDNLSNPTQLIQAALSKMMKNAGDKIKIGQHEIRFDKEDLMIAVFRDVLSGAQIAEVMKWRPHGTGLDYFFCLVDFRELKSVMPDALRATRGMSSTTKRSFYAVVGASFTTRVAAELAFKAANLLAGRPRVVLRFFDDPDVALGWLEEERRLLKESP